MDQIPISEKNVLPLEHVTDDVRGLRILFVNVFGIVHADRSWTLIDAGIPGSAPLVRSWAEREFGGPPRAIVLTHGHFDHAGGAHTLAHDWNVRVYAHPLESPFLTGREAYPPPDPSVGGGAIAWLSPLYPREPYDISTHLEMLPVDASVPTLDGWRMIETPGHTVGHISLFRDFDRLLLPGDAFCTTNQQSFFAVATQKPELNGPPAYFTSDWESARRSVEKLAALNPQIIAPGHGLPMRGAEVATRLQKLAAEFDRIAKPEHGKYVDRKEPAA